MTVAHADRLQRRDPYRFGSGPHPALQPGTVGWSLNDLNDPAIRVLWDAGRYEINNGVLAIRPPALFEGGQVVDNLKFIVREYLRGRGVRSASSSEVDIAIDAVRVLRADGAIIVGDDLTKFEAQRFPPPDTTWRRNPLTLPPTIVIESVSRGHEVHDRVTKRKWYAEFGVPNYWIVDAFDRRLECLRLEGGAYQVDVAGRGAQVLQVSAFPELTIDLQVVWDG